MIILRYSSFYCLSFLFLFSDFAVGDDRDYDLLKKICEKNQAAMDAISSIYCKFSYETNVGNTISKDLLMPGEFWKSGENYRIKVPNLENKGLDVYYDHERLIVSSYEIRRDQKKIPTLSIRKNNPATNSPFRNIILRTLFVFDPAPTAGILSLSEIAEKYRNNFKSIQKTILEGREIYCIRFSSIDTETKNWDRLFYVDPKVNYLVRKFAGQEMDGDKIVAEGGFSENLKFIEPQPGVFFPVVSQRVVMRKNSDGSYVESPQVITLSLNNVLINKPLPKSIFEAPFIPGTQVYDYIQNVKYLFGKNGEKQNLEEHNVSLPPSKKELQDFPIQEETTEESQSWTRWILPFSFLVLFLAGLILLNNRRKALA